MATAPIKVWIVELCTDTEVKPLLLTANREDADAMIAGFDAVQHELGRDNELPRLPVLNLRSGWAFYQATPCVSAAKEVLCD